MMSTEGIFSVTVVISQGMPMAEPELVARGFISHENTKIMAALKKDIEEKTKKMLRERAGAGAIQNSLQNSLKNTIYRLTRRNPIIVVRVIEV